VPPNILLIVLDTARADAFEPYGAATGASPAVADLARAGRALPDVRSTACWTVPSHASMFTGLLPRAAGLDRAPGGMPAGCRPIMEGHADRVLPEVLRRAGYRTRGVSTNLWITGGSGFATGFDDFRAVEATRQTEMVGTRLRSRAAWALDALRARSDDGAAEAGRILRGWLREPSGGAPSFWFVNLIEAHSPYLPPRPWNDLGAPDRLRAAAEARRHLTLGEIWRACVGDLDVPEDALERMRHLYARSIRQLDDWLAAVLEDVDLADTLVLLCSDHGENLGDGGLIGHAYSLDDRLTRVPFVAAGPGAPDAMRSLVELPRAVARAAGIEHHPWAEPLPGAAVAQFSAPVERGDARIDAVGAGSWGLDAAALARLTTSFECAADGARKLIRTGGRLELVDLEADPLEVAPRAVDAAAAPADLLAALDHPAARAHAGPAAAPPAEASPEELERIEHQMRTLGYL
jgi:arylsulfatase A-like enzyme